MKVEGNLPNGGQGFFSRVRVEDILLEGRRGHILPKNLSFECCVLARGPGFNHQETLSPNIITKANITHLKYVYIVHVLLLLIFARNNFES